MEAPMGASFTPEAFLQTFESLHNKQARRLSGPGSTRLAASGGLFVEVAPTSYGGEVKVWGFRPDLGNVDLYGRWTKDIGEFRNGQTALDKLMKVLDTVGR